MPNFDENIWHLFLLIVFSIYMTISLRGEYLQTLEIGKKFLNVFEQNTKYKLGIGKILIAIILIYILVIVSNSFLVHFTIKSISNDAALINSSGKIRGGIQRAVKLTLQDRYSNENILIIDKIFKDFSSSYEKSTSKDIMKDFYIKLKELEYSWSDLKILLSAYDKNKTFDLKEKILDKSEETWVLSMETLDIAQKLYDEKIGSFLSIFIIFTINLFFGFIIIYSTFAHKKSLISYI